MRTGNTISACHKKPCTGNTYRRTMTTARQKNDPFAAMRIPEYRNLMMGRFLFIMGL
ncbi:MAG: hypothetical protein JWQ78_1777, partial [Sediminibacterium sp.]|nr:hypothetical protein [Sediminibacterium sp.]